MGWAQQNLCILFPISFHWFPYNCSCDKWTTSTLNWSQKSQLGCLQTPMHTLGWQQNLSEKNPAPLLYHTSILLMEVYSSQWESLTGMCLFSTTSRVAEHAMKNWKKSYALGFLLLPWLLALCICNNTMVVFDVNFGERERKRSHKQLTRNRKLILCGQR